MVYFVAKVVPFVAKGGPVLMAKGGILPMAEIGILYLTIYSRLIIAFYIKMCYSKKVQNDMIFAL